MTRRVVVTGRGGLCALGQDWKTVRDGILAGRSGVVRMPEWEAVPGLRCRLAAPLPEFQTPEYPRKKLRTMGRVSVLATRATELALADAGLTNSPILGNGSTGIAYGSSSGSPPAIANYARNFSDGTGTAGIGATEYIRFMSHTCAANLGQFFGICGRLIPTCSACTSGSQGIGYGYEAIKFGQQAVMVAGGAEEIHVIANAVFDILYATSTQNDDPNRTPRPFDEKRDGLVIGEGAATLVLEDLEHAQDRGVPILAEVLGYGTNCDGRHLTNPDAASMERVLRLALADASVDPAEIDYVNAHGTATKVGDLAESQATHAVFGTGVPVSSLKSYLGHSLGACGAIEAWLTLEMMREGWLAPTLNLETVDPACAPLDHIRGEPRRLASTLAMSNNFAFGGVNTSLIFKRWEQGSLGAASAPVASTTRKEAR